MKTQMPPPHRHSAPAMLFAALFDDAAIFPPGDAPIAGAVAAHREWRASSWASLVGPFICAATRWEELTDELAAGPALRISLTIPDGIVAVRDAVAAVVAEPRAELVSIEVPSDRESLPDQLAEATRHTPEGSAVYIELPWSDVGSTQLAMLARANARLKIRTGGVRSKSFPTEVQLGRALWLAVRSAVPYKLTAGLHEPVRHRDDTTGFEHHGHLNVLAATARAIQGQALVSIVTALATQDPQCVADEVAAIDPPLAQQVRRAFIGLGTCSILDPIHGLLDLGLVQENLT